MKTPKEKKTQEKIKPAEIKDVNFSSFRIRRKTVSVNGKELPIAIGDRIILSNGGPVRTCMGITVQEDGRVSYVLEWHDPQTGGFTSEQLTLMELKLLDLNAVPPEKTGGKIGFGPEA